MKSRLLNCKRWSKIETRRIKKYKVYSHFLGNKNSGSWQTFWSVLLKKEDLFSN